MPGPFSLATGSVATDTSTYQAGSAGEPMGPDLPLGDIEARQWQTELLLQQDWAQRLHELRGQLDAPRYISTREGV